MLQVECDQCKRRFWVKGHTTPDSWDEPGEVVTELEVSDEPLCACLMEGGSFAVVDESHPSFDDDVI
jgi:hypothetical protein